MKKLRTQLLCLTLLARLARLRGFTLLPRRGLRRAPHAAGQAPARAAPATARERCAARST